MTRSTLKDVALRAGVSAQTVSEVVHDTDRVAPATRERVLAAMKALDYEPNHAARAMRLSKSFNIAYVVAHANEFTDPAMGLNLASMLEAFDQSGYGLSIRALNDHAPPALEGLRRALKQKRIDGAIISALPPGRLLDEVLSWPYPLVLFDQPQARTSSVWAEYRDGIVQAVAHLASRGRTRIAFIGGPSEHQMPHYLNTERHLGYLDGLAKSGLRLNKRLILNADYTVAGGRNAALKLLQRDDRPDAIVAASDRMAFGVLQAASTLGLRVPEDLAVTGFDDHELAQSTNPPLTTVRFPIRAMALKAAELLIAQIDQPNGQPAPRAAIPVELVVRDSS
jgi:LacI family transcriptional regulator